VIRTAVLSKYTLSSSTRPASGPARPEPAPGWKTLVNKKPGYQPGLLLEFPIAALLSSVPQTLLATRRLCSNQIRSSKKLITRGATLTMNATGCPLALYPTRKLVSHPAKRLNLRLTSPREQYKPAENFQTEPLKDHAPIWAA
jgi:hypothetical protein